MRIALVGQPNCGKSTLFNRVAGYKSLSANYPSTTCEPTTSPVALDGQTFELVDMPGFYSLASTEPDEVCTIKNFSDRKPDLLINVIDASALGRSLELTLEITELGIPFLVCLNMMDEAQRKGVVIDSAHLARDLEVPVVATTASSGKGVAELFRAALAVTQAPVHRQGTFFMSADVEGAISELSSHIPSAVAAQTGISARLMAIRLLEPDDELIARLPDQPALLDAAAQLRQHLEQTHGRPSDVVLSSERHALALNLFEHVAKVRRSSAPTVTQSLDRFVMHPYWGPALLLLTLIVFFSLVFGVGHLLETPLLSGFERLGQYLARLLPRHSLWASIAGGLVQGLAGGIGMVLPYLLPFFVLLALLEDVGYIPRIAVLMDSALHRIGLHGKAIIPFVLGYGCTVPAVMSLRLLESSRDRLVGGLLVNLIPCAARTTIIFALVGFYLGPGPALGFYALNLLVVVTVGRLLFHLLPEATPGMVLEVPSYKAPALKSLLNKVWYRIKEFIVIAWPILIVGSIALSLLEYFDLAGLINRALAPFTRTLLGLPAEVGITLISGLLRKELAIAMLGQALGTTQIDTVMSSTQLVVYTAFSVYYVPCLATLAMLQKVIGLRQTIGVALATTVIATLLALGLRLILGW